MRTISLLATVSLILLAAGCNPAKAQPTTGAECGTLGDSGKCAERQMQGDKAITSITTMELFSGRRDRDADITDETLRATNPARDNPDRLDDYRDGQMGTIPTTAR